jgi:hypothetical protein
MDDPKAPPCKFGQILKFHWGDQQHFAVVYSKPKVGDKEVSVVSIGDKKPRLREIPTAHILYMMPWPIFSVQEVEALLQRGDQLPWE